MRAIDRDRRIRAEALSFRKWLEYHRYDTSHLGDLARDVICDSDWPKGPGSYERYEMHLIHSGACDEALAALANAWSRYERDAAEALRSGLDFAEVWPASYVVLLGICTASCLLASRDDADSCACKCEGAYHAVLANAEIQLRRRKDTA